MSDITAPRLIWWGSGSLPPGGKTGSKYKFESCDGVCATCHFDIDRGVPVQPRRGIAGILNKTFSGHAEYIAYGTHVCDGCAWLYGEPKLSHRAVLAIGDEAWWPTISQGMDGRPKWHDALRSLLDASPDTPMTGVLTVDPKPRLWPRARVARCANPGLYVHWTDYDVSRWMDFDALEMLRALSDVSEALCLGVTKREIMMGAATTRLVDKLGFSECMRIESAMAAIRGSSEHYIATLVATAEAKCCDADSKSKPVSGRIWRAG